MKQTSTSIFIRKYAAKIEIVAYSDYPSAMVEASNPKDLLTGAKNDATQNINANINNLNFIS